MIHLTDSQLDDILEALGFIVSKRYWCRDGIEHPKTGLSINGRDEKRCVQAAAIYIERYANTLDSKERETERVYKTLGLAYEKRDTSILRNIAEEIKAGIPEWLRGYEYAVK